MSVLTFKTPRHQLFIAIQASGTTNREAERYADLIDAAADKLHELCLACSHTVAATATAKSREEAYRIIMPHVNAAVGEHGWIRAQAGGDLCRRVLFLLAPDRFGFETCGWVH